MTFALLQGSTGVAMTSEERLRGWRVWGVSGGPFGWDEIWRDEEGGGGGSVRSEGRSRARRDESGCGGRGVSGGRSASHGDGSWSSS